VLAPRLLMRATRSAGSDAGREVVGEILEQVAIPLEVADRA